MKRTGSFSLIALLFAATFVAPAAAAEAMAPGYMSSEPSDGEMLDEAPERVEVTFDEPLDQSSVLTVSDECGRKVDDGDVEVQANTMSVGLALKPTGKYEVSYFAKGVGGLTGQESGTFDFMVHSGPSCGKTDGGGHGGHNGGNNGGHDGGGQGSGQHRGGHQGGGNGGSTGQNDHSGGGSGGSNHDSTGHNSSSTQAHSSTNLSATTGSRHGSGKDDSGKHGSGKPGGGKHGGGKHGAAGAHGRLDILEKNERKEERALAAGLAGDLTAPDGEAVVLALALSLLMGVVGGWFLRVSGAR
jgi:methionine-rich copper-binding protein CopC